ncbi:hypothetical protein RJ639_014176 [Escallonia herrerae]|uniref:RING-type E3 ubiquitin transferase n=1 Tax=Escallonia herrerae TaxID=1293975 RepID=A0AA89AM01_9ASTE|nr:hypothetical protein RJ639_014176 [Escallonia herrerae]
MSAAAASYWCYRCSRVVRVVAEESVVCPRCDGGFVEAVEPTSPSDSTRRFPAVAMYMVGNNPSEPDRRTGIRFRRGRRNNSARSPFNPVIVLRGPPDGGGDENSGGGAAAVGSFEFYYDDGAGSGLRPLPETMSDFLMGSGFDRLLDQLSRIEINGLDHAEQPPASKASIESMPTISIGNGHVSTESSNSSSPGANSESGGSVSRSRSRSRSRAGSVFSRLVAHKISKAKFQHFTDSILLINRKRVPPSKDSSLADYSKSNKLFLGLGAIPKTTAAMSFVFRGARPDIESGLSGFVPGRRTMLWLVLGVFLVATTLRMYATCQQLQAQAQAHAAAATGLLSRTEFRLQMPPSIALATRGRLHGLRLQLALLDREFDDLDYETLRALDSDNGTRTTSMSEEEINALPVHKYKATGPKSSEGSSSQQHVSSSSGEFIPQIKVDIKAESNTQASEEELTCSICLEQFHANCIDPWLRQQGTCPVCKLTVGSGWQENTESETDGDDMTKLKSSLKDIRSVQEHAFVHV